MYLREGLAQWMSAERLRMQRANRLAWLFGFISICFGVACKSADCPLGTALVQDRCVEVTTDGGTDMTTDSVEGQGGKGGSDGGDAPASGEATTGHNMGSNGDRTRAGTGGGGAGGASGGGAGGSPAPVGGSDAPEDMKEPCTTEGEVRCSTRATGQRDKCTGGVWGATEPCTTGQTCTSGTAGTTAGSCAAVAEVCRGSGGQPVCDGQGVMYLCNADGVAESKKECGSALLCNMGLAAKECLKCVPGEHQCTEASLERCEDDGSKFVEEKKCPTAALCNATLGDCTDAACVPNKKVCDKDALKECNADQTALKLVKNCMPGMCDTKNGECDVCVAGAKTCDGDDVVTCNAMGQGTTNQACPSATPRCVGAGKCVQCTSEDDCGEPGTCKTKFCNISTGMCQPKNAPSRTRCDGSKFCDGAGACVTCLASNDCGDPGTCKTKFCDTSTHTCAPQNAPTSQSCSEGHCNGSGKCVQCSSANECDEMECKTASCNSNGQCTYGNAPAGTRSTCGGSRVCSGGGCVECVNETQCVKTTNPCAVTRCEDNKCVDRPRDGERCGDLRICKGMTCSNSCNDGIFQPSVEPCDASAPGGDTWSCVEGACRPTGYREGSLAVNCTSSGDCGPGLDCDSTWFGSGLCLPSCSSGGGCSPPPGYTSELGCNTSSPQGQSGCLISCGVGKKPCPSNGVCSNPSATGFCLSAR